MKFNRDKLEELVRKKIDKVNEETGYRPHFETTEMVDLVAEVIEEKLHDVVRLLKRIDSLYDCTKTNSEIANDAYEMRCIAQWGLVYLERLLENKKD